MRVGKRSTIPTIAGRHHVSHEPGGVDPVTGVPPVAHSATHEPAGADEVNDIDIGNTGVLLSAHKARHETGGADALAVLDAAVITTGEFPLARMPRAASGQFLEGAGVGANPIFNALVEADIPHTFANLITLNAGAAVGAGQNVDDVDLSKYSKFALQWHGYIQEIVAGVTEFLDSLGFDPLEVAGQYPVPEAAVAVTLYIQVTTNTLNVTTTVTLRKNGADQAITLTIGAGATGVFSDIAHSVSFAAGDLASIKIDVAAGTGNIAFGGCTVKFAQGTT